MKQNRPPRAGNPYGWVAAFRIHGPTPALGSEPGIMASIGTETFSRIRCRSDWRC